MSQGGNMNRGNRAQEVVNDITIGTESGQLVELCIA